LPADRSAQFAREIVAARAAAQATRNAVFEAREDLLQLRGFDYDAYARLAPLVTTDSLGGGKVNPLAAPEPVLAVLAAGNAALAGQIATARDSGSPGVDTSRLQADFVDTGISTRYRLRALVRLPDGRGVSVIRTVELAPSAETGLPWKVLDAEERLEPPAAKESRP
jgi:general secretion pathway protein K